MAARLDGRRLRSRRTHERLVSAYLELVAEAGAAPTCTEVARRAGCSVRTLFDRFRDMADLARTATERAALRGDGTLAPPMSLDRATRIRLHVTARARLCERWLPVPAATRDAQANSDDLSAIAELETLYERELSLLEAAERRRVLVALGVLTDVGGWARLRRRFGVSMAEACDIWQVAIDRLLPPTPA